jgi:hypothetical protein
LGVVSQGAACGAPRCSNACAEWPGRAEPPVIVTTFRVAVGPVARSVTGLLGHGSADQRTVSRPWLHVSRPRAAVNVPAGVVSGPYGPFASPSPDHSRALLAAVGPNATVGIALRVVARPSAVVVTPARVFVRLYRRFARLSPVVVTPARVFVRLCHRFVRLSAVVVTPARVFVRLYRRFVRLSAVVVTLARVFVRLYRRFVRLSAVVVTPTRVFAGLHRRFVRLSAVVVTPARVFSGLHRRFVRLRAVLGVCRVLCKWLAGGWNEEGHRLASLGEQSEPRGGRPASPEETADGLRGEE